MKRDVIVDPPAAVRAADESPLRAARINALLESGDRNSRKGVEDYRAAGLELIAQKKDCGHGKWLPWLKANVRCSEQRARQLMSLAKSLVTSDLESQWRVLQGNGQDDDEDDGDSASKPAAPAFQVPEFVTLAEWGEAGEDARAAMLSAPGEATFNGQDGDNIEWAQWSWNPVTGCEHDCPYCYARDIAERFYRQKFQPSFWPSRLSAPFNTTLPEDRISQAEGFKKTALRNVFTCSMADLFGRWVPREWIDAVIAQAVAAPDWNFLFLTKFPQRLSEFSFPKNAWIGTTVDCQARVANAEKAFAKISGGTRWLSLEPMLEPLTFKDLGVFDWLVIGGSSRSSRTPEWHPPVAWVEAIKADATASGVPYYEKSNLHRPRVRSYPGEEPFREPTEAPAALKYLPSK